jgi:hypothetical protein
MISRIGQIGWGSGPRQTFGTISIRVPQSGHFTAGAWNCGLSWMFLPHEH